MTTYTIPNKETQAIIDSLPDSPIQIISGEGTYGTGELYRGPRTLQAIKTRLTRERCGGSRWARAEIYSHKAKDGTHVGIDLFTGSPVSWTPPEIA